MKAVREEEVELRGQALSLRWKREGVVDEQSGETKEEEDIGEVGGDSELEELVPE